MHLADSKDLAKAVEASGKLVLSIFELPIGFETTLVLPAIPRPTACHNQRVESSNVHRHRKQPCCIPRLCSAHTVHHGMGPN
jgi:hypothetical protein